jgi:hypothetical protein
MVAMLGGTAEAAPITIQFTALINVVDAPLSGTFALNQIVTGSFTYESTTAPRAGGTAETAVFDPLINVNFSVAAAGYSGVSNGDSEIQLDADLPAFPDRFFMGTFDGLTPSAVVNGYTQDFFAFHLTDSTRTALATALALPTSLNLADWDFHEIALDFSDGSGNFATVRAEITDLQMTGVPEPATLMLFGTGLAATYARIRRRAVK